jgi:hypothetical protein
MGGDITEQPLAHALLRHLAGTRGEEDPMGSLARTVLSGEATLRKAADDPQHGQGLAAAFHKAMDELNSMSGEQRAEYERAGARIRQAVETSDRAGDDR